jgi:hypothetical protein
VKIASTYLLLLVHSKDVFGMTLFHFRAALLQNSGGTVLL